MWNHEARYPCPVCLGLPMEKLRFINAAQKLELILDSCKRCGGIWFDAGEVQLLSQIHPQVAMRKIELRPEAQHMKCHQCMQVMGRNDERCGQCGWHNRLDCPVCVQPMQVSHLEELKLDYCKACQGIWFDNIELSAIWNRRLAELSQRQPGRFDAGDAGDLFLDVLTFSPHLTYLGAEALGRAVYHAPELAAGAVEALANLPGTAGNVVEGAGELAGGIFEAIGMIIASIFGSGE